MASLGTFVTGYLARPVGGVVFGHFGDRLGRKRMLVLTMVVTGEVRRRWHSRSWECPRCWRRCSP
ncbi:hypothetical protein ACQEVF_45165 [Nonomuraea polychroma]|uniref:hypothetical protein n=1 Tax=Nonomuraea polychroma TaxID=46176 RepID=UPI003D8F1BCD